MDPTNPIKQDRARRREDAVIIAGASAGIGLALAREFARKGHSVVMIARGKERLVAACEALRPLLHDGRVVVPLVLDVTDVGAVDQIDDALVMHGLRLDVLINNAGIGLGGPFADQSVEDIERLIAINVSVLTRLTHHAITLMRTDGRGHVINIASLGGYVPGPNQAAYYASKAYVISLSEALDWELSGSGVRVAVAAPGPVDTGFHSDMQSEHAFYRKLMPSMSASGAAGAIYRGYRWGSGVIIPGFFNRILGFFMRGLPHPITVPIVKWLLAQRRT